VTWAGLIRKNLLRRPSRTAFTAVGVGLGVALIVALLAIVNGVHRTADDLIHVGSSDFGLFLRGAPARGRTTRRSPTARSGSRRTRIRRAQAC
jgi:hypothetical protein